jgi:hypothetical protein
VGNQQTNAFRDDGPSQDDDPSFPDTFSDASQNLGDDDSEEEVTLSELARQLAANGASKHGKLIYQFVVEKATNLVCLAQSDPIILLRLLCSLLDQLASRLGNSQSIEVQLNETKSH